MTKPRINGLFLLISICISYASFGQFKTIEGIVLDSKKNEVLAFATIGIKGTTVGTASNSEGRFILSISEPFEDSILFCSYMGYKNFEVRVRTIGSRIRIDMEPDTFTLDEVEVRPWQPWDYIWNAMQKIPENYAKKPYMTNGYYSEYITENDIFLKYTEGVIETFNPPYGKDEQSQSKVLKARRRDDLGTLRFMRKKLEKKYEKEKRKAHKNGEEWEEKESIDEEIISASFGGPEEILSA
ncbi:MAG: carboxypeptidase-like regulatory domain-containing protein, partial [Cyclobacteriaceae bacterium]|nr:carboxypeptidase-like regulatory domain-containing protein [Cyclobacteriaceae bacterium]